MSNCPRIRIGIVGTGFVSRGFVLVLNRHEEFVVSRVLTRRNRQDCTDYPYQELLTNSVAELINHSDILVECSGDVIHATAVIDQALKANLPVVTMDSEFHVTTGSYFVGKGMCTEAEGDQPGCLAAFREDIVQMGFKPLVYGSVKGFLNKNPTPKEMEYWATRQGISFNQATSFTDGTKAQIEQALVANGLDATIIRQGLLGPVAENLLDGALILAGYASKLGEAISDYVLSADSASSVFIVAEHDESQRECLRYFRLGDGPSYLLVRNYHLVHLEIIKTVKRVINGKGKLLDNSAVPKIGVAAIAKRNLKIGERIVRGIGSFDVRGEAVLINDFPDSVPIGLLYNATMIRNVDEGQMISSQDVALNESLAVSAWEDIKRRALTHGRSDIRISC